MDKISISVADSQKKTCVDCGVEYLANAINLFGNKRDISGGRCLVCREKAIESMREKECKEKLAEIETLRKKWRLSSIPEKYWHENFSTFEKRKIGNIMKVYQECVAYADNFPIEYSKYTHENKKAYPSMLMMSPKGWGVGKTHLACAIAHKILDKWNGETLSSPVMVVSEPELLSRIQSTFSYSEEERRVKESEQDIVNLLISKPLLILDDVAKEKRHDPRFVQRVLFAIINGRYNGLRPIIITTNADLAGLNKYLCGNDEDEAIMDRLTEMCSGGFREIVGESYRNKANDTTYPQK